MNYIEKKGIQKILFLSKWGDLFPDQSLDELCNSLPPKPFPKFMQEIRDQRQDCLIAVENKANTALEESAKDRKKSSWSKYMSLLKDQKRYKRKNEEVKRILNISPDTIPTRRTLYREEINDARQLKIIVSESPPESKTSSVLAYLKNKLDKTK